jgi:hypothetical protein
MRPFIEAISEATDAFVLCYPNAGNPLSLSPQVPGWPNRANFRPIGAWFLWTCYGKLHNKPESLFSTIKSKWVILTKMGWATSWVIFSQTHLVTLPRTKEANHELLNNSTLCICKVVFQSPLRPTKTTGNSTSAVKTHPVCLTKFKSIIAYKCM